VPAEQLAETLAVPSAEPSPPEDTAAAAAAPASPAHDAAAASATLAAVPQAENPRSIVFVASEVAPWSKTGGLADVCQGLPPALAARGHRVMVVAPRYGEYEGPEYTGVTSTVWAFGASHTVGFHHEYDRGVDWVFVDHPGSYMRAGTPYGDAHGTFGDNQFRYTLLSLAALEAPLVLPLGGHPYGDECVFFANDWHTGLVPVYLAAKYRPAGVYLGARCVFAIHNLFHQGVFPPGTFGGLGLAGHWFGALDYQYPEWARQGAYEEEGHSVNTMKGALCTADRIVTVSPSYAAEIQEGLGGCGLDGVLRGRSFHTDGVLNGVADGEWDPMSDEHIEANYGPGDLAGKAACKAALQREMGLPEDPDVPLLVFIGRLDQQKGADLLTSAVPWLMEQGCQLVCLGSGEEHLEHALRIMETNFRESARGWVGFNVALAHRMIAGADMLLMPSRFEPCGLNQLYAMRYGTVPVVHATGGLKDTVPNFDPFNGTGTGWTFSPASTDGLISAVGNALVTYREYPESFAEIQARGMAQDFSWNNAAERYEQIFDFAAGDLPFSG